MIDDLLDIAADLTRREAQKPKRASLCRAVSSAYYAVFHALAQLSADELVGRKSWTVVTPIYRSLEHQKTRMVMNTARSRWRSVPEMRDIAVTFITLQDARHMADYSPEPLKFKRHEVLDLIDSAVRAVAAIRNLPQPLRLELAVQLIAKPR